MPQLEEMKALPRFLGARQSDSGPIGLAPSKLDYLPFGETFLPLVQSANRLTVPAATMEHPLPSWINNAAR